MIGNYNDCKKMSSKKRRTINDLDNDGEESRTEEKKHLPKKLKNVTKKQKEVTDAESSINKLKIKINTEQNPLKNIDNVVYDVS